MVSGSEANWYNSSQREPEGSVDVRDVGLG